MEKHVDLTELDAAGAPNSQPSLPIDASDGQADQANPPIDYSDTVENIALRQSAELWVDVVRLEKSRDAAHAKMNELAPHRERLLLKGDDEALKLHDETVGELRREAERSEARRVLIVHAARLAETREVETQKEQLWREVEARITETAKKVAETYPVAFKMICELAADVRMVNDLAHMAQEYRPASAGEGRLPNVERLALGINAPKYAGSLFRDVVLLDMETASPRSIEPFVEEIVKKRDVQTPRIITPPVPMVRCRVLHGMINNVEPGDEIDIGLDELDALISRGVVARV